MKNKATNEHSRKRDTFIVRKNLEKHQHIFEQYEEFGKELTARLRAAMVENPELLDEQEIGKDFGCAAE